MLRLCTGDLLDDDADVLVNAVNCVGVMGAGIAKQFKVRFPAAFQAYKQACAQGEVRLGWMWPYALPDGRWILHAATKNHWRERSDDATIVLCLTVILRWLRDHPQVQSMAIPLLGCGCGGLSERVVLDYITMTLRQAPDVDIRVYVSTALYDEICG